MLLHTYYTLYIIGSQSNYTVVIDGFYIYHNPLYGYHISMHIVICFVL